MKNLYIFDFDGTLVNTFYDSVLSYNKALKKHNLPQYEYDKLEDIDYTDFVNSMTHDEKVLNTYKEIYETSKKENTLPYPGVVKVLQKLIDNGKELAICSNRIENQLISLTEKLFPEIEFKYIIGYIPNEGFKPNPSVMNRILDNVNYPKEEIVYIGDKKTDIITAQNVEVDAVIVTWGQGEKEAYNDEYPIKVLNKVEELLEI